MSAQEIRSTHDIDLAKKLLENKIVLETLQEIENREKESTTTVRRHLLATSLRLAPTMMPSLQTAIDECGEKLGIEAKIEAYVYPSASFNAAAVKSPEGEMIIMFSSSLLESFKGAELKFVVGHELGHHVFGHHDIPIGTILKGEMRPPADLALSLFAWSRYAELSADRAGAFCADDQEGVSRSLFRLASGLRTNIVKLDADEFGAQVDLMKSEQPERRAGGRPRGDWFLTHPFSPLRLRALELFWKSQFMVKDGESPSTLEQKSQALMALMEPSYLEGKTEEDETMRRLLFSAALVVADADGEVSPAEIEAFENFFGEGSFSEDIDHDRLETDLMSRIEAANEAVNEARRMQLIRDISVVARADGHSSEKARAQLLRIARALNLNTMVVDMVLDGEADLD